MLRGLKRPHFSSHWECMGPGEMEVKFLNVSQQSLLTYKRQTALLLWSLPGLNVAPFSRLGQNFISFNRREEICGTLKIRGQTRKFFLLPHIQFCYTKFRYCSPYPLSPALCQSFSQGSSIQLDEGIWTGKAHLVRKKSPGESACNPLAAQTWRSF